jgi:hypothetical protein
MLRYSLILVVFLGLIIYVFRLGKRGQISGRFRTVSLILLALLTVLVATGLYYNATHYSVQTVQEEFSQNRSELLNRIRAHLDAGEYERARKLAGKYQDIQDPELERLFKRSREAELLKRAEQLDDPPSREGLAVWKELAELTGKPEYRDKARQLRTALVKKAEKEMLERMDALPDWSLAAKALGYSRLERIDPGNVTYRQRFDNLKQQADQRIQGSPWNDICSASTVEPCAHFGFLVRRSQEDRDSRSKLLGEVLGVSRRSKGTLIDRNGTTAPEDGYYYLVFRSDHLVLKDVRFVEVEDPFQSIHIPKQGEAHDQQ